MKYKLKEHPYIFLVLLGLVCVVISVVIGCIYGWDISSIIAISLSGLGTLLLLIIFFVDLSKFKKGK